MLLVPVATEVGTLSTVMSTPVCGVLSIAVSVEAVSGSEDATIAERGLHVVSELIDRLAVRCGVGIGSVEAELTRTPPPPPAPRPTSTTAVSGGDLVIVRAGETLRAGVGPLTRSELQRALMFGSGRGVGIARQLTEPLPGDLVFHSTYREVLRARDVLVRFVLLYAVLEAIGGVDGNRDKGGTQKDVDEWILRVEPDAERRKTRPMKHGSFGYETVYTRIRKDLVHGVERKAAPDAVRALALRHSRNLQRLVWSAVLATTAVTR